MSVVSNGYTIPVSPLLFPRLKKEIENIRQAGGELRKTLPKSKIQDIIKEELNLNISVSYDHSAGPNAYIMQPLMNEDSPFLKRYNSSIASGDAVALIRKSKNAIEGGFDAKGKAFGVFAEIHTSMAITRGILTDEKYTPGNVAAILCHEIGHYRTSLTVLKYSFTTPMLLRTTLEAFLGTQDREVRLRLTDEYEKAIGTTIQSREKLIDSNDEKLVTTVIVGSAFSVESELRTDAWDVSACEQMADQFAVACGAAGDLSDALGKSIGWINASRVPRPIYYLFDIYVLVIKLLSVLNPFYAGFIFTMIVLRGHPMAETYNRPEERLQRIRQSQVTESKASWLTAEQRKQIKKNIETTDEILKKYKDRSSIAEKVFLNLTPKGRRDKKNTDLVRLYEQLMTNELHVGINNLKTLN